MRRFAVFLFLCVAPASIAQEKQAAVIDDDYRFRIDPIKGEWRLLREHEMKEIVPDALAGAVSFKGYYGVVIAESAPDVELKPFARFILDNMPLESKKVLGFEEIEFKGRTAVRFDVTGTIGDVDVHYQNTVFLNDGFAFQVLGWGPRQRVHAGSFRPFLDAFRVLEGNIKGRSRLQPVADTQGVGWRVTEGVFESAAMRMVVEPRGNWALAVGVQLQQMNADAEVGLVHSLPDVYVTLLVERASGVDKEKFTQVTLDQWGDPDLYEDMGESMTATIAGREVKLHRFKTRGVPATELVKGAFFEGDFCVQLVGWYVKGLKDKAQKVLPEAFASIRFMSEEKAAALGRELQRGVDPENRVGPGHCLRRGIYRDFDKGFSWRKPDGYWRVLVGDEARMRNEDAVLFLEEPAAGLVGLVITEPAGEFSVQDYHKAVATNMFGEDHAKPAKMTLDGVEALSTEARLSVSELELAYRVVTTMHNGHAFQFLVYGVPGNMEASSAAVDALIKGVRFPRGVAKTSTKSNVFADHRLGFSLRVPDATWRHADRTPKWIAPMASLHRWRSDDDEILALSICAVQEGQNATWFAGFIEKLLADRLGGLVESGTTKSKSTLGGLPCDVLSAKWKGGSFDTYLLMRDRTFYALMLVHLGDDPGPTSEQLKNGFHLID
jgi:hypothetical protein